MKATLAIRIGVLSLAAAGGIAAFMFEKKIALAPPRPAPASIMAGDTTAEKSPRIEAGKSLEDRASAALENAAGALSSILGDQTVRRTDRNDGAPAFDVARIEPTGEAVIAGRTAPGATVELLRAGELHDQTLANEAGEFVILARRLPPGNYDLTLRSIQPDGQKLTSKGSVAVVLGPRKDDRGAVASADPRKDKGPAVAPIGPRKDDRPAVALVVADNPVLAPSNAPLAGVGSIAIDNVETKPEGKLYVSGRSASSGAVRLYLNGAYIASATPSAEGRVVFAIESGVTPGDYRVRLEKVDPSGSVQAHAELSFNAPAPTFATASVPRPTPAFKQDSSARPPLGAGPAAAASDVTANRPTQADQAASPAPAGPSEATEKRPPHVDQSALPRSVGASEVTEHRPGLSGERALPRPPLVAETRSPPAAAADPGDKTGAVVVPKIETTVVARGDNLWRISRANYGKGVRYPIIVRANREQIRNPDLIHPGQVFVLPNASDSEGH